MTDSVRHRGPDAEGTYFDRNVGLGHRRLSVIDVSQAANQPLFNEDGSVCVVCNGEIYNFTELRRELEQRGHTFRSQSDCEVIVHAWEEFGPEAVHQIAGMFALAVYDSRRRTLFLARDRLGKKPLFYHSGPDRFLFGSEIKAIHAAQTPGRSIDPVALAEYVAYGNSLSDRTIYQSVRKLRPGHSLLLNIDDDPIEPTITRYWDLSFKADRSLTEDDWLVQLDESLDRAVQRRLVSDVPLGSFLSGGVDSSLVTAYAARHRPGIETFSIGFHESSHDESSHAALVARHLGCDHHVEIVSPSALEVFPQLIEAYDEPFADSSAIPTFYLARMTRRRVTVALSGDGGDELHAGYRRYVKSLASDRISSWLTPAGRWALRWGSRGLPLGGRPQYALDALSRRGFDVYNFALGATARHLSLLRRDFLDTLPGDHDEKLAEDFAHCKGLPLQSKFQYLDAMNYLPEDILVKVDRASMFHALEVRCPLLDHEFVELSARIPPEMNRRGFRGKRLLKRLAARYVPREVLDRPKMGFGVPLCRWFRTELRPSLEEMLADRSAPIWDWFDHTEATHRVALHLSGKCNAQSALWRLLYFHRWSETHRSVDQHRPSTKVHI